MFPLGQEPKQNYDHVPMSEETDASSDSGLIHEKSLHVPPDRPRLRLLKLLGISCAAIITVVGVFALGYTSGYQEATEIPSTATSPTTQTSSSCKDPYFRKEWRSLSKDEKKSYLDAFQCFIDSPSAIGMNGSLYDDFSWVHNLVAHSTHTKAPFLTWHRRFLFVYEKYLKEKCHYKGAVPFWDWTLDWEDLPNSPIFDSELGFGGDGDPDAPKHGVAQCVTDTPLKNLRPKWFGEKYEPHCLSRLFNEDWYGHYLNPEALAESMSKTTYTEFFLALEMRQHDIIPMGIRGDFTSFTAPNDPIFYLHHSQLDRLWWLWQMRDKSNRMQSYGGMGDNGKNVTLTDVLPLAGLDKDVTVSDIMDTEAGELCYRYMYY